MPSVPAILALSNDAGARTAPMSPLFDGEPAIDGLLPKQDGSHKETLSNCGVFTFASHAVVSPAISLALAKPNQAGSKGLAWKPSDDLSLRQQGRD